MSDGLLSRPLAATAGVAPMLAARRVPPATVTEASRVDGQIKRVAESVDTSWMDACPSCGARVTPEATWCGQCFAAIDRSAPRPRLRGPLPKQEFHQATYSRWRGGETSFGPVGRTVMTIGVLLGLVVGYPLTRGLIFATVGMDVPGAGFLLMYGAMAVVAGIWLLGRIWRRTRVT